MIYTITFNPAVDYYVEYADSLKPNDVNYASNYRFTAGGKGINCSVLFNHLGIESTVLSFFGGFTGKYIQEQLQKYEYIHDESVEIEQENRMNVKLNDGKEYILNSKGPKISEEAQGKLLRKLDHLTKDDYVMVCGKNAEGIDMRLIYEIADRVNDAGAKLILDTNDCRLEDLMYTTPFLIKPNLSELGGLLGKEVTIDDCQNAVDVLLDKGVQNVLLTLGSEGAYFKGTDGSYLAKAPKVKVYSTNGAGDSSLAGFIGSYMKDQNIEEALKWSMASGTAAVTRSNMPRKKEIEIFLSHIEMEKVG